MYPDVSGKPVVIHKFIHTYPGVCILYIYIYIYIERERERERCRIYIYILHR